MAKESHSNACTQSLPKCLKPKRKRFCSICKLFIIHALAGSLFWEPSPSYLLKIELLQSIMPTFILIGFLYHRKHKAFFNGDMHHGAVLKFGVDL